MKNYKIEKIIPSKFFDNYYSFEDYEEKNEFKTIIINNTERLITEEFDNAHNEDITIYFKHKYIYIKIDCLGSEIEDFYNCDDKKNKITFLKLKHSYFFRNFKVYELFEILAIINSEKPDIEFEFYKIGEKYGFSETTRVNYENKIVKTFFIIEDEKRSTINEYYKQFKINNDSEYISILVKFYLEDLYYVPENNNDNLYEEKYTIEDSYYDAGGGQEWSDPDEFW